MFSIVYGVCYLREKIATRVGRGLQNEEIAGREVQMQEIDEWEEIGREEAGTGAPKSGPEMGQVS